MINLKTKLVSVAALVSLVGTPALSLAQSGSANPSEGIKSAVRKELENLKEARESFKVSRDEAKERAKEAREKAGEAKGTADAKKLEAEKRRQEHRKEVLLRSIELQIKHFQSVASRVAKMPNISDDLKASLKTEIDKAITGLNDLKTKVQNAKTEDELKAVAKEIKDYLKNKREIVKKIVDAISASHLKNLIEKARK